MKHRTTNTREQILRLLPSIDVLLRSEAGQRAIISLGATKAAALARQATERLRREILDKTNDGAGEYRREDLLARAENLLQNSTKNEQTGKLQAVINATGVIVHTNLGRAPLSENARRAINEQAAGYCNLEYDLETGKRGKRGARTEQLLAEITGAESALVVNNCAAACFLVLTALAKGGEAIISRGELVEIGGDFRIPDVMEQSGTILREVGATNRTRLADYASAIGEKSRMILRVHPSNYRIVGFTSTPDLAELAVLAHQNDLLFYEDAGSGALLDLSAYGLTDEPVIAASIKAGADVVTFSGDKLLGGAQAGLIVGRGEVIENLRKNPLYRALRVDKLIYAALEATLESFGREKALQEIPVLRMLSATPEEAKNRTSAFAEKLRARLIGNPDLHFETIEGNSVIGGGSAPTVQPATRLLAFKHEKLSASELERALRFSTPPVIARVLEDHVLVDLRTVSEAEEAELLEILSQTGL